MAVFTCTRVIDLDEPRSPENTCGAQVNAEKIETSVPGTTPVTIYICPVCDLKPESLEEIERDGWMASLPTEDAFDELPHEQEEEE